MLRKLFAREVASVENPEGVPSEKILAKGRRKRGGPKSNTKKAQAKQRRLRRKSRS